MSISLQSLLKRNFPRRHGTHYSTETVIYCNSRFQIIAFNHNHITSHHITSHHITSHLISAQLSSAQLSSAQLSSAQLSSAQLSSAQLSSAQLSSSHLISSHLISSHLISSHISQHHMFIVVFIRVFLFTSKVSTLDSCPLSICTITYQELSCKHPSYYMHCIVLYENLSSFDYTYRLIL